MPIHLTRTLAVLSASLIACLALAQQAEVTMGERSFTIRSPRLAATVQDGVIVGLRSLATGEVHADPATADVAIPCGMGHLTGDPEKAAALHTPWGTQTMNQNIEAGSSFPTMHHPHPDSVYEARRIKRGVRATWRGLTNGDARFPDETLTVEMWVEEGSGQLLYRASASSPDGGVYGLQVPLANLAPSHRFYVPSFGGVMYTSDMSPALITLIGQPFWEAPVVGIEGSQGSLGLWIEDEQFHPHGLFLNWSGTSFSVALESQNLMPFEDHTSADSVTWRLDGFAGGWVDAMTPYKNWYASVFAEELEARATNTWADRIRIIVDHFDKTNEAYREIAANFDPETVLFHEWNARAPVFDQDHPDMEPREGYVERVAALKRHGFHTMAYVNTYCVNYKSPVYQRDGVGEFALPRTIRSFWKYMMPRTRLEDLKEGQLVYLDPLPAGWRRYHTDMMIEWNSATGTDANYEDTGGYVGDFGNGVIDGKFGAQGSVAMFQELQTRNPTIPMASEYCPDAIAFAVRWPLRFQQVWGVDRTREWWMERMRPVSAYIFGPQHRPWVPTIRAESNFLRHVIMACSDSLGGMAQFPCTAADLRATRGVMVQMKQRAQLFAARQLKPVFTPERLADDLACVYEDEAGRQYRYYADANRHRMVGPDGKSLYERVAGLNQLRTDLTIPGWPAAADGRIMGLAPDIHYALVPGSHDRTKVQVTELPEGVRINRFYETDDFTVLGLAPVGDDGPAQGQITLLANAKFGQVLINDQPVDPPVGEGDGPFEPMTLDVPFPSTFVFIEGRVEAPGLATAFGERDQIARYIMLASGLDRGGEFTRVLIRPWEVPGEEAALDFRYLNLGGDAETTLDYLVRVPDATSALNVYLCNAVDRYGNGQIGRLYINGRPVHEYSAGPWPNPDWEEGMDKYAKNIWDNDVHRWRIPVGHLAGQPILVSIATDGKGSNNADNLWWTRPTFVADPDQQASFVQFTEDGQTIEEQPREQQ